MLARRLVHSCLRACHNPSRVSVRAHSYSAAAGPLPPIWKANSVTATGSKATTEVQSLADGHTFTIDQSVRDGGLGTGACPVDHLLGAAIGCSQATMQMLVHQRKLDVGQVWWRADTKYDVHGVRAKPGNSPHLAEFNIVGEVETQLLDQAALDALAADVEARCVVAATLKRSGAPYSFRLVPRQ